MRDLEGKIDFLEQKFEQTINYYDFQIEYKDSSYNYLAIGNSLTLIQSWGRGICATKPDGDYFNIVVKKLRETHTDVVAYPINFSSWEKMDNREKALELLNPYLDHRLDLVTIQLGENVTNLSTFENDLEKLIDYVKTSAPDATILVIGDFWNSSRNILRNQAAINKGALFADISEIIGDSKYQSATGIECELTDGTTIIVSQKASTHPGDEGMKYIAKKVIETLQP